MPYISTQSARAARPRIRQVAAPQAAPTTPQTGMGSVPAASGVGNAGTGRTAAQDVQAQQGRAGVQQQATIGAVPTGQTPMTQGLPTVDWNLVRQVPQAQEAPAPVQPPLDTWGTEAAQPQAPAPRGGTPYGTYAPPGPYGVQQPQMFESPDVSLDPSAVKTPLARQKWALGGLGDVLVGQGNTPVSVGDIPLIEARLNYENLQKAEEDRQRGYEELARGRAGVGSSPESMAAKEYFQKAMGEGPFGESFLSNLRSGLQAGASTDYDRAVSSAQETAAQRGMGGGMTPYEAAMLRQQGSRGLATQLSGLEEQYAVANQQAQQQAATSYQTQALEEASQRAAIDELLANIFLNTERGAIDLSGLINAPDKPERLVGALK